VGEGEVAIFALVVALLFRVLGLATLHALFSPASTALAACSRAISASISVMIPSMGSFLMPEPPKLPPQPHHDSHTGLKNHCPNKTLRAD
jgi:hypothetical protein